MSRAIIILLVALTIFSTYTFAHRHRCPKNEEFIKCGSPCQTTCSNLGKPCTIINIRCNDACYCIKGYARSDNNNRCIPIKRCPKKRN
ncbi:unnamed protein product [Lasius platythorax]|uniref:TIL domain-containing protein n=1 Tax=Lasius platythorax TaxID=488582 RepID=A0AAV2P2H5_9HYME